MIGRLPYVSGGLGFVEWEGLSLSQKGFLWQTMISHLIASSFPQGPFIFLVETTLQLYFRTFSPSELDIYGWLVGILQAGMLEGNVSDDLIYSCSVNDSFHPHFSHLPGIVFTFCMVSSPQLHGTLFYLLWVLQDDEILSFLVGLSWILWRKKCWVQG